MQLTLQQVEINGHFIGEVIWRGKIIVYVDSNIYNGAFEDAVKECEDA